jgi:hypothetical protein
MLNRPMKLLFGRVVLNDVAAPPGPGPAAAAESLHEHGLLRGNARHGWLRLRPFGVRDSRLALSVYEPAE